MLVSFLDISGKTCRQHGRDMNEFVLKVKISLQKVQWPNLIRYDVDQQWIN